MPVVRIDWREDPINRGAEQKKILIEKITNAIHDTVGVDKSRVIILINDFPGTCVGMNGKPAV
ncbi:MAG: tautomerase family protein [Peptostreptococcaceae bacterium]|nr:tautomerase family protein [Peptostreptococcaceae bacterium]